MVLNLHTWAHNNIGVLWVTRNYFDHLCVLRVQSKVAVGLWAKETDHRTVNNRPETLYHSPNTVSNLFAIVPVQCVQLTSVAEVSVEARVPAGVNYRRH